MSKRRYNAVMKSKAGPTIAARFILSILADKAKDDGYCYPGPEWVAKRANCDITTVRRALKALNREGSLLTYKSASFPKYEHLVLVGLTAAEVEAALKKHFGHISKQMMAAISERKPLFFKAKGLKEGKRKGQKEAECPSEEARVRARPKMQNAPPNGQNARKKCRMPLYPL